jgi:hypothetical protein
VGGGGETDRVCDNWLEIIVMSLHKYFYLVNVFRLELDGLWYLYDWVICLEILGNDDREILYFFVKCYLLVVVFV